MTNECAAQLGRPKTDPPRDICARTAVFADRVVRLSFALPPNPAGWEIGKQIVRAGMSIGANVEEAQADESKVDFLHKLRIARKECREARYFLERIVNAEMIAKERMDPQARRGNKEDEVLARQA